MEAEKTAEELKADEDRRAEDAEIVQRAKDCYRIGIDATAQWRSDALEDLEFLAGDQWDPDIKGRRALENRPALTVNRLPQFVRQVTNEQRQSKPAVTVSPVDDKGDKQTAEVIQGVIRNVEYTSNADAAYASGGQSAAVAGLGYWDVVAEYEDERSFEQRLSIRRIPNPLSVVMDPGAKEVAGDDARWVIKSTDISSAEWKSMFPGREMPRGHTWDGQGDSAADWVAKDGVRIHEYRYVKEEPDELVQVPPGLFEDIPEGGAVLVSELAPGLLDALSAPEAVAAFGEVQRRPTVRRKACWAKIAGDEVIDRGELAGKYLQLVRVVGTEWDIDGKTIYEGIVRHAKDSQRMHNFFVSAEAEAIGLAPKAPWIMAEGQDEGYETEWETANLRAHSRLIYKPTTINGHPAPPPQRVMAEANVSAITNARMQSADDLKAVTGIYDAALGAKSNETSGRAILARESQGQTANFHYADNLAMAIRYTGRILIDLIPKIYAGPRVLRMLGEDDKQEMVPVNQPGEFRGQSVNIQLDAGRYDVAVSMGRSYNSRRQEASAQLLELSARTPQLMSVAGDLVVKTLDIPGGAEIAKRLEAALPPQLKPQDEKAPPTQVLQQQLAQYGQLIDNLTAQLKEKTERIERNAEDNESRERIEFAKLRTSIALKLAELESAEGLAALKLEHAALTKRLQLTDIDQPIQGTEGAPQ